MPRRVLSTLFRFCRTQALPAGAVFCLLALAGAPAAAAQALAPSDPSPPDGAMNVPVSATLQWNGSSAAEGYNLWLWSSDAAVPAEPTTVGLGAFAYDPPGDLNFSTVYRWQVSATSGTSETFGPIWNFATAIEMPHGFAPADKTTGVLVDASLSWEASEGAYAYDLYFWKLMESKLVAPTATVLTETIYQPPAALDMTTYFWQVVAKNEWQKTVGPVLSFTTEDEIAGIADWIEHFYLVVLGRAPEPGAVEAWESGYYDAAVSAGIDVRFVAREMGRLFFLSEEYAARERSDADFIRDCYNAFLLRTPWPDEVENWTRDVVSPGKVRWNRAEVMTMFAESREFEQNVIEGGLFPNLRGDSTRNFVATMYIGVFDRLPDLGGLNYWASVMDDAAADKKLEAAKKMALAFFLSEEGLAKAPTNEARVVRFYRAFLGRFPADDETVFWTGELDSGKETLESLIEKFGESEEFGALLDAYFRDLTVLLPGDAPLTLVDGGPGVDNYGHPSALALGGVRSYQAAPALFVSPNAYEAQLFVLGADDDAVNAREISISGTEYQPDEIWVDFAYAEPVRLGTFSAPFNTFAESVEALSAGGTVYIKGDTADTNSPETMRIDKAMRIEAVNGAVSIGRLSDTITIAPTPTTGTWTLAGPEGFAGNGQTFLGNRSFSGAPAGKYTLTGNALQGYVAPTSETKTLAPGESLTFSPTWTPIAPETAILLPGDVPLELVRIPYGSFQMGSPSTEQDRESDEGPVHTVTLGYDFYMGKYELTKRQWQAVLGTAPWSGDDYVLSDLDSPAVYVSWNNAQSFVNALNAHITATGQGSATLRLPSESEWEYACRAGTQTRFYWGDDPSHTQIGDYAWWNGNTDPIGEPYAHVVGKKLPNAWGLHDMSGNVWEWCQDGYSDWLDHRPPSYSGAPTDGSAWEPPSAWQRVLRGGRFSYYAMTCRSANRSYFTPSDSGRGIGFRLATSTSGEWPNGVISIDISPDTGSWALAGPAGFAGNGQTFIGDKNFTAAPVGEYVLTCDDNVLAYDPPASEARTLADGRNLLLSAIWTPEVSVGEELTVTLPGDVPLVLVRITSGSFQMGSPDTEQGRQSNEGPLHTVHIGYDFYMGKYELTKRQWKAVMGTAPWSEWRNVFSHLDSPAVWVSWNDAQSFLTALNAHIANTGQGPATLRLPSESEWEYACRAGSLTRFYWGVDPSYAQIGDYAWWIGNASDVGERYAHVVGRKLPNAWGLYDMSGNVDEWCQDVYYSNYNGAPTDGSAWESPTGTYRVLRGGNWNYDAQVCRSAYRYAITPDSRYLIIGFRLLLTQ